MLIKTDFHHVIQLVCSPSGDDHTSIGREAADIKRNNPAHNIDFADEEFAVVLALNLIPGASVNQNLKLGNICWTGALLRTEDSKT